MPRIEIKTIPAVQMIVEEKAEAEKAEKKTVKKVSKKREKDAEK